LNREARSLNGFVWRARLSLTAVTPTSWFAKVRNGTVYVEGRNKLHSGLRNEMEPGSEKPERIRLSAQ